MIVQEFLDALRANADLPLVFDTGREIVPAGYHVTEIKQLQVRSMDCGGRSNAWNETVVQVWPPARPEGEPMAVGKFLSIYDRVTRSLDVDAASHLRVEYGAQGTTAVGYLVEGVRADEGSLRVRLASPTVACKGRDRSVGDLPVIPRDSGVAASADGSTGGPRRDGTGSEGLRMVAAEDGAAGGACCAPAAPTGDDAAAACCG